MKPDKLKEATQQGTTEGRQLTAILYLQIGIQPSSHWSPPSFGICVDH